jgi:hypothetical protein
MQSRKSLDQLRNRIHASISRVRRSALRTKQLLEQLQVRTDIDQTEPGKRIVNKPR